MKDWLLDLFFPPKCIFCQKLLPDSETMYCSACGHGLPETDEIRPIPFTKGCRAPFHYRGDVREALLRFKFGGRSHYADPFAAMMAVKLREVNADLITWVPVSRLRRFSRGYDQAQLLAEAAAKKLNLPCVSALNKRHRKKQSRISGFAARKANISGAFTVVNPEQIKGKTIILIDDICTTGATMGEAAYVLHLAGAAAIHGAVYAIAKNR